MIWLLQSWQLACIFQCFYLHDQLFGWEMATDILDLIFSSIHFQELGHYACFIMPFSQTMAVLANSIILVCIAFDRYIAIQRLNKGPWEPTKLFCIVCCTVVWSLAAAVASPMLRMYDTQKLYVFPDNFKEIVELKGTNVKYYTGYLCTRSDVSCSNSLTLHN